MSTEKEINEIHLQYQKEFKILKNRVKELESFLSDIADIADIATNWDCDTGASGVHPSYCRSFNALKLYNKKISRILLKNL